MSLFSIRVTLAAFATFMLVTPVLAPAQGRPVSFTPKKCPTCPTMTDVQWKYQIGGRGSEIPFDPNCAGSPTNPCPHYINWMDYSRYITGNGYIKQVGLNFTSFDTEPVNDTLSLGEEGGSMTTLSGSLSPGWHDVTVSGSLQTTPIVTVFDTDDSIAHPGLEVDGARVCCSETETTGVIDIQPYIRYTGLLLGTGDVVYYRIPAADETTHTTIAMWGYPSADPDPLNSVDVHVRCNQLPNRIQSDYKGVRHSHQEFIHIPEGPSPPACEGHWYIAAHSRGGAHTFNLVVANHFEAQHRTLKVGFEHAVPPSSEVDELATSVSKASKFYFGATEGTQYFDGVEVYTTGTPCRNTNLCGGSPCDICFHDEVGRSNAVTCSSTIAIRMQHPRWTNLELIAHEMGHKFFCVGDEYYNVPGAECIRCGHTIMSDLNTTQYNFCYSHITGSLENHKKDADPGCPPPTALPAWQTAYNLGLTPWKPSETPDNHTYLDFDFAGKVGTVVVY